MLDWLTARPVAHRGLHDAAAGVIENTPSAFRAAIAANYAIECDVQITLDGEAMVYHDDALGRLTHGVGRLADLHATEVKQALFRSTTDRMLTLGELSDLVAGRVTLVVEIKSRFDGDLRLIDRAAKVLENYRGRIAIMSFDPEPMTRLRQIAPGMTRGLVAMRRHRHADRDRESEHSLRYVQSAFAARPQFLAFNVQDLPSALPCFMHNILRMPLLTWTVRTDEDRARAARWADQVIFEGFHP